MKSNALIGDDSHDRRRGEQELLLGFGRLDPPLGELPHCIWQASTAKLRTTLGAVGARGGAWGRCPLYDRDGSHYTGDNGADDFVLWKIDANQEVLLREAAFPKLEQFSMVIDVDTPSRILRRMEADAMEASSGGLDYHDGRALLEGWIHLLDWAYVPLGDETGLTMFVAPAPGRETIEQVTEAIVRDGAAVWQLRPAPGAYEWLGPPFTKEYAGSALWTLDAPQGAPSQALGGRSREIEEAGKFVEACEAAGAILHFSEGGWDVEATLDQSVEKISGVLVRCPADLSVVLYDQVTDMAIGHLTQLSGKIVGLTLGECQITRAGLRALRLFRRLRTLSIIDKGPQVSARELADVLSELPQIGRLRLSEPIADADVLDHLRRIQNLTWLMVGDEVLKEP